MRPLINDIAAVASSTELNMRIVQAQESERPRLAREVHDGPAQALSNAIFQVEYVSRVLAEDPTVAAHELDLLCATCCAGSWATCAAFISQLRPPLLDELGLDGSIGDAVESVTALTGIPVVRRDRGHGRGA